MSTYRRQTDRQPRQARREARYVCWRPLVACAVACWSCVASESAKTQLQNGGQVCKSALLQRTSSPPTALTCTVPTVPYHSRHATLLLVFKPLSTLRTTEGAHLLSWVVRFWPVALLRSMPLGIGLSESACCSVLLRRGSDHVLQRRA